jgi:hypothetical protein
MRYRKVRISGQFLVNLCITGTFDKVMNVKGLPEGTRFAYCIPDSYYGIYIVVEHESFDKLEDGALIPDHPQITFEQVL